MDEQTKKHYKRCERIYEKLKYLDDEEFLSYFDEPYQQNLPEELHHEFEMAAQEVEEARRRMSFIMRRLKKGERK